jgi:CRP-like cAMP-binding protein
LGAQQASHLVNQLAFTTHLRLSLQDAILSLFTYLTMTQALIGFINTIVVLPEAEEEKLLNIAIPTKVAKGAVFIAEGSVPKKLAFVAKGLFRYYYTSKKGAEFTKGFFPENSFITAYSAMAQQRPSTYTIEALEDSDVFVLDYYEWRKLNDNHPCWNTLLMAFLHKGYFKKERREREFLLFDAKERYESFLEEYPQLEQRLKQSVIASYLGITPVALSRIRSQRN